MFDNTTLIVLSGEFFNIKPALSSLYYVSAKGNTIFSSVASFLTTLLCSSKSKWYIVREGDVAVKTNSSELLPLNSSKLRFQLNLKVSKLSNISSLTCCNFVKSCSMNSIYNTSKQEKILSLKQITTFWNKTTTLVVLLFITWLL